MLKKKVWIEAVKDHTWQYPIFFLFHRSKKKIKKGEDGKKMIELRQNLVPFFLKILSLSYKRCTSGLGKKLFQFHEKSSAFVTEVLTFRITRHFHQNFDVSFCT